MGKTRLLSIQSFPNPWSTVETRYFSKWKTFENWTQQRAAQTHPSHNNIASRSRRPNKLHVCIYHTGSTKKPLKHILQHFRPDSLTSKEEHRTCSGSTDLPSTEQMHVRGSQASGPKQPKLNHKELSQLGASQLRHWWKMRDSCRTQVLLIGSITKPAIITPKQSLLQNLAVFQI